MEKKDESNISGIISTDNVLTRDPFQEVVPLWDLKFYSTPYWTLSRPFEFGLNGQFNIWTRSKTIFPRIWRPQKSIILSQKRKGENRVRNGTRNGRITWSRTQLIANSSKFAFEPISSLRRKHRFPVPSCVALLPRYRLGNVNSVSGKEAILTTSLFRLLPCLWPLL